MHVHSRFIPYDKRCTHIASILVLFLTQNQTFLLASKQWRRSEGYFWLLAQIANSSFEARELMIRREVLIQIVDLITGDLSPMQDIIYPKGSRKYPPSSFVPVVPTKSNVLPGNLQPSVLPDWTYLFHLLAHLTTTTSTEAMLTGRGIPCTLMNLSHNGYAGEAVNCHLLHTTSANIQVTMRALGTSADHVNPNHMCIALPVLYSLALKQARYIQPLCRLVQHEAYEWLAFSKMLGEVLVQAVSFASLDGTAHCFQALEAFLTIEDSFISHRTEMIFFGPNGLLLILQDLAYGANRKPSFVCICLYSLLTIVSNYPLVRQGFATSQRPITSWAPWMLQFAYQYLEKVRKEEQLAMALALSASASATGSNSSNISSTSTSSDPSGSSKEECLLVLPGPFLVIHGEGPDDRERNWTLRSEALFALLQSVLRALGEQPEILIPATAFEDYDESGSPDQQAGAAQAPSHTSLGTGTGSDTGSGAGSVVGIAQVPIDLDGDDDIPPLIPASDPLVIRPVDMERMTDEELAIYLSQNQDKLD